MDGFQKLINYGLLNNIIFQIIEIGQSYKYEITFTCPSDH